MKKWDFAVIAVVALLSLAPLFVLPRGRGRAVVAVSVKGETVYTGDLHTDAVIEAGEGNAVTIEGGRVTMSRADCPDGLCLHGEATAMHPLVCLPNGVTVTVTGGEGEEALDGISY